MINQLQTENNYLFYESENIRNIPNINMKYISDYTELFSLNKCSLIKSAKYIINLIIEISIKFENKEIFDISRLLEQIAKKVFEYISIIYNYYESDTFHSRGLLFNEYKSIVSDVVKEYFK